MLKKIYKTLFNKYIFTFGKPKHNQFNDKLIFICKIYSYLSFLSMALILDHGNSPFKKYINIYPKLSKSSLLDYSIPIKNIFLKITL